MGKRSITEIMIDVKPYLRSNQKLFIELTEEIQDMAQKHIDAINKHIETLSQFAGEEELEE